MGTQLEVLEVYGGSKSVPPLHWVYTSHVSWVPSYLPSGVIA
jgi:hypothetical protein